MNPFLARRGYPYSNLSTGGPSEESARSRVLLSTRLFLFRVLKDPFKFPLFYKHKMVGHDLKSWLVMDPFLKTGSLGRKVLPLILKHFALGKADSGKLR